jgi:Zn-dependent metalloprotease
VHHGVPVWGHEIYVHIDEHDRVYNVSGQILTGLENLDPKPLLPPQRVNVIIEQHDRWGKQGWKIDQGDLYVLQHDDTNYLAYELTLVKGLLREFLFVNADTGSIIHRISGTPTATRF